MHFASTAFVSPLLPLRTSAARNAPIAPCCAPAAFSSTFLPRPSPRARTAPVFPLVRPATPACSASASPSGAPASEPKQTLWDKVKVPVYILGWYLLNIGYNIYNKKALNVLPLPWTVAWAQLFIGAIWVVLIWLFRLRAKPVVPQPVIKSMIPVAAAHTVGHVSTVLSLGAVAVSFTHVIKSMEPFFNVVGSAVVLKSIFPFPVYASLLPVVVGVIIASVSEVSFTWMGFISAMISNVAFTARNIFSKLSMNEGEAGAQNLTALNIFGVLSVLSTILLLPFTLAFEGAHIKAVWTAAVTATNGAKALTSNAEILKYLLLSGLYFQVYQEVAFLALESVHPVTHSVANTVKRIVIIITSILVFKNPVTRANVIGSSVAIFGVFLYSLTKNYYDTKAKKSN